MRLTAKSSGDSRRGPVQGEEGYILIAVLFLMVMILIALSVAAPKVAADIQRDREIELMHRGKQYQRAIQLYYRKFGKYPPSMEALEKSNEIRFLRKRYKDPATGKEEWHMIHFGEAKTQTLGFFGQPIAGAGSAGGSVLAGVGPGASGGFGSPIGGTPDAGASPLAPVAPVDPNAPTPANPDPNAPNVPIGVPPTANGSSPSATDPGSTLGGGNQTFGGGGIIGVESTSPRATILEYKKMKHLNEWEFVYDPLSERRTISGGPPIGQPIGGDGGPGGAPGAPVAPGGLSPGPTAPTPTPQTPQQ